MKKILISLTVLLLAFSFAGCDKEGEKLIIKETITANDLSPLPDDSYVLLMANAANVFNTFTWTAVDFGFPAEIRYTIQVDTAGKNFKNAVDVITVTSKLTADVVEGELNKILLAAGFKPDVPVTLQFRIKAVVNSKVTPIYSDAIEAGITPYAVIFPPIFMCGDATGGWNWDLGVEVRSTLPNVYSTIAYFTADKSFRFFKQHDWGPVSYNYPYFTGSISTLFVNAEDGDKNFKFTGASGYYKITINMTAKSVAMEAVAEPKMFMTGDAVGGWNWTTDFVQMTWRSNGMFEATTEFINDKAFRFFAQKDWSPTSYNYPYFADGQVSTLFINALDGDKNFKFTGTTGTYLIKLNMLDKKITMTAK